jgi:hypothetical protein
VLEVVRAEEMATDEDAVTNVTALEADNADGDAVPDAETGPDVEASTEEDTAPEETATE